MRYRVAKGWKVKGSDGGRYVPGQIVPLLESDIERLLMHGAVVQSLDIEDEDEGNEEDEAVDDDDDPGTGELHWVDGGDEDGAAEVNQDVEQIPAAGGGISDAETVSKTSKSRRPAAKKPKG